MFILRGILRAESQEKILIYLLVRQTGYGRSIAEFYGLSQNAVQKQLARLEEDGVLVSRLAGRLREYQLSPRYPFLPPLKGLLKAALAAYPSDIQTALTIQRERPRAAGKPIIAAR
ncbi:MAG: winged helix-turn-helix domain-containing protein [Pseudomonadales bacterium]